MKEYAKLIDLSKCTGCQGCRVACKSWNQLPGEKTEFHGSYQALETLTPTSFNVVVFKEMVVDGKVKWLFRKHQCMHCTEPTCVEVCPQKAIKKYPEGFVLIDEAKCTGSGECAKYCPYEVPKVHPETKKAKKCVFCYTRVLNGLTPACVKTCTTGALSFGLRSDMLAKAKKRLEVLEAKNPKAALYGEKDPNGGLHVLYILEEEPEAYNLVLGEPLPFKYAFLREAVQPLASLVVGGTLAKMGVDYLLKKDESNQE